MIENNSKVKHIVEKILKVDKTIGLLLIIIGGLSFFLFSSIMIDLGSIIICLGILIGILFLYNRNLIQKDINSGLRMHIILLIITLGILIIFNCITLIDYIVGVLILFLPPYYLLFRLIKRSLGYYKTTKNKIYKYEIEIVNIKSSQTIENNPKVKHIVENILKVDKIIGLFFIIIGFLSLIIFSGYLSTFINFSSFFSIAIGLLFLYNRNLIQKDIKKGLKIHITCLIAILGVLLLIFILPLSYYIFMYVVDGGMWTLGIFMHISVSLYIFPIPYILLFRLIKRSLGYYKTIINEVNNQIY